MKKVIIALSVILLISLIGEAQTKPTQKVLIAKTEKEMYEMYRQLLDSSLYYKQQTFSTFRPLSSADTIMRIEQKCYWYGGFPEEFVCENWYNVFLSNAMSLDFYERFLYYLDNYRGTNNIFYMGYSNGPLYLLREGFIKHYESSELSRADSIKALDLIEKTTLLIVNDSYNYEFLYGKPKYITDFIREALINAIKNPFYPKRYLDYYLKEVVDTMRVDTTGIPIDIRNEFVKRSGIYTSGNSDYDYRLNSFYHFKEKGDELGISPGQACIEERKQNFIYKGYLHINVIADYANRTQDTLIVKYLKEFKKKHPDYPLRHFK
jgi:hypothetical protein